MRKRERDLWVSSRRLGSRISDDEVISKRSLGHITLHQQEDTKDMSTKDNLTTP